MAREYATEQVFQDIGSCSKVTLALATTQSANTSRTIRLPANVDDTLVGVAATQTLTNKTLTSPILNDVTIDLPTITNSTIINPVFSGLDADFTLSDSSVTTKKVKFECGSISADTTRTVTFPDDNITVVGVAATQTLTNKTLTAPVISTISNSGTLTLPTSTDTLVGRATTDTLTNKTIADSSNTISPSTASSTGLSATGPRTINLTTYPFNLRKIGNNVTMHWKGTDVANSASSTVFTISGLVPVGMRPAAGDIQLPISIQQNTTRAWGSLLIQASGDVQIGATPAHGNFTSGQTAMWYQGSVSWVAGI